jgi:hypothetical protein
MQRGAMLMLVLLACVEILALVGGVVLVKRHRNTPAPELRVLTATTMSPRTFGWWLIITSITLMTLAGYLLARFHA